MKSAQPCLVPIMLLTLVLVVPAAAKTKRETDAIKLDSEGNRPRLSLRISGGLERIAAQEFNKELENNCPYFHKWTTGTGEYFPLHWGPHFNAEIVLSLPTGFGIGLGFGFLGMNRKNEFQVTEADLGGPYGSYTYAVAVNPKIKVIPITLTLRPAIIKEKRVRLEAVLGAGIYRGVVGLDYREGTKPYPQPYRNGVNETWEGRSWNLGFHGGASLDLSISPRFSAFVEILGRYAELKDLRGTAVVDGTKIENATLWWRLENGYHAFSEKQPSGMGSTSQAVVDLSGVSIQTGIVIALGRR